MLEDSPCRIAEIISVRQYAHCEKAYIEEFRRVLIILEEILKDLEDILRDSMLPLVLLEFQAVAPRQSDSDKQLHRLGLIEGLGMILENHLHEIENIRYCRLQVHRIDQLQ